MKPANHRPSASDLLPAIRRLHDTIRDTVVAAFETSSVEAMSRVDHESAADTIYAVDRVSEEVLVDFFNREVAVHTPIVLIAEGLPGNGQMVLPEGRAESDALWRVIVDPIDGTREIMYQKRSAWILTGVAPNRGAATSLQDIELAVQTEIPLLKQHLSDQLWAVRGEDGDAERFNRLTGERTPLTVRPSQAESIENGFAMISRFYPGARDELAAIDEEMILRTLGPVRAGKAHCFEDQYLSTAGQLYELMAGRYRFVADLRPLMESVLARRGLSLGICCHPYDICTELIARQLGVIVTDAKGQPVDAPLTVDDPITWAGYANANIRAQVESTLQTILLERGVLQG